MATEDGVKGCIVSHQRGPRRDRGGAAIIYLRVDELVLQTPSFSRRTSDVRANQNASSLLLAAKYRAVCRVSTETR